MARLYISFVMPAFEVADISSSPKIDH